MTRDFIEQVGDAREPDLDAKEAEIERLKTAAQRALDHYDMRSELYTNDADVAAGMASILRAALESK